MEDTRQFPIDEDDDWHFTDDERVYDANSPADENGVPFSVPRD